MVEPATTQRQIKLELSSQQETLKMGQGAVVFAATVYNDSDRFASFQLKLLAAGVAITPNKPWYRLAPAVSSKIPAGDYTCFQIEIFDLPPITDQFRGAVDLTIEVTSRELDNQYDRQSLRLLVEGIQGKPPGLTLLPGQPAKPGERVEIRAEIHNALAVPLHVTLQLLGLPDAWFPQGTQQLLVLEAAKLQKVSFICELPEPHQVLSQIYPLHLEATGPFPTVTTTGELAVLPMGTLTFLCDPLEASIPETLGTWQNPTQGTAEFTLQVQNQSNVEPPLQITVEDLRPHRRRWFWQPAPPPESSTTDRALPDGITLAEVPSQMPLGTSQIRLRVQRSLPWFGWTRLQRFQVTIATPETDLSLRNPSQTLQVQLFPIIPLWQQILGLLLAIGLGSLTWFLLSESAHRGPVNSVQFNGQGTEILSGSDDQTVRRWQVQGRHLNRSRRLGKFDKAVRVIHYRPVDNDQVAVGFENGEIQVINLLTGQRSRLVADQDDRVMALAFSRDARTLYSGHGSGLVLPWDISRLTLEQPLPERAYDVGFAIQAIALVADDSVLAIGGRFNRLLLLKVNQASRKSTPRSSFSLNYPSGGSTDYISSLSTADQNPELLAISDTQGRISLWNIPDCIAKQGRCDPLDRPWLGHNGSPVRSVALSADGCFLASAGDDGQVKLWSLDQQGSRRPNALEGRVLARLPQPLNSVDVIQSRDRVWVVSGGDDRQVRLASVRLAGNRRAIDTCPALAGDRL